MLRTVRLTHELSGVRERHSAKPRDFETSCDFREPRPRPRSSLTERHLKQPTNEAARSRPSESKSSSRSASSASRCASPSGGQRHEPKTEDGDEVSSKTHHRVHVLSSSNALKRRFQSESLASTRLEKTRVGIAARNNSRRRAFPRGQLKLGT